jgi:Ion transport protein.
LIFAILDKDGSEKLELNEFLYFGQAMLLEFEEYANYGSFVEKFFPSILESAFYNDLKQVIHSDWFERSIDLIVTINAVVVVVHSYPMLAGKTFQDSLAYAQVNSPWEVVEILFTIIFALEMMSKLAVFGVKRYFSSLRNIFDGAVTISAIFSAFYTCFTTSQRSSHLTRFIIMARVFRILRFFVVVKQFKTMSKTFFGILPAASRVALLLFCVIYTWSWIGMHFFGGLITRDPNNPTSYLLEGTDFADAFYWANNFNDMLSGANVCFNLLVINNWNEMESGIVAVAQTKLSRYFFLTFYIMGVMIVNNLVIALVIDYFLDEFESDNEEVDEVFESGRELVFDSDELPTPKEFGKYVARLNPKYRLTAMKSKKVLKQLFSQRVRARSV